MVNIPGNEFRLLKITLCRFPGAVQPCVVSGYFFFRVNNSCRPSA
jgi:hypothetical protein